MLPLLFLRHFYADQLNKGQKKKEKTWETRKNTLRAVKSVWGNKQTWQWRETPHSRRRMKNQEDAANSCQRCTEFSFPLAQKKPIHCISSVQRRGTDGCCDQKGQTQLSLLRLRKSHKATERNSSLSLTATWGRWYVWIETQLNECEEQYGSPLLFRCDSWPVGLFSPRTAVKQSGNGLRNLLKREWRAGEWAGCGGCGRVCVCSMIKGFFMQLWAVNKVWAQPCEGGVVSPWYSAALCADM